MVKFVCSIHYITLYYRHCEKNEFLSEHLQQIQTLIFHVLSEKKKYINSPIRLIKIKPCVCDRSELQEACVNARWK